MMAKLQKQITPTFFILVLLALLISCTKNQVNEDNKKLFVFELDNPRIDMKSFNVLVEKLNEGAAGEFKRDEDSKALVYLENEGDVYFEQDSSTGNLSFNKGIKKYLDDYKPELPAQDKSADIAIEFLKGSKLMPGSNKELKVLHSGGLRADSPTGKGVIDKMRTITYGRILGGIPVIGSGSKIVVHVGDKGKVTGLIRKWREVSQTKKRAVKKKEVISEKEARRSFAKIIAIEFGEQAKANINSIKLLYYDGDGRFIQPVYGVESTVEIKLSKKNVNRIPYLNIMPALKQPPEDIKLLFTSKDAKRYLRKQEDGKGTPNDSKSMD